MRDPASADLRSVLSRCAFLTLPSSGVHAPGRMEGRPPISTKCRAAALAPPGQSSGSGRRRLHRRRGRPAIARGAIRQKGYEPRVLLVVQGATGYHLVGHVGGVDGVDQCLPTASPGSPTSATSCGWEIEKSRTVPWNEESLRSSRGARHGECSGGSHS